MALARDLGPRRAFVATAEPGDDEMKARIRDHRRERGTGFDTIEAPRELIPALERLTSYDVVVVDCVTFWLSNLLMAGMAESQIQAGVEALSETLASYPADLLLVSNEVGMGVVPETSLGRQFRDLAGRAHQRLAAAADELYFAALGVVLRLRPGPLRVMDSNTA